MSLRDVERAMIVFTYFCEKIPDFQKEAKEIPLVQVYTCKIKYCMHPQTPFGMYVCRPLRAILL